MDAGIKWLYKIQSFEYVTVRQSLKDLNIYDQVF